MATVVTLIKFTSTLSSFSIILASDISSEFSDNVALINKLEAYFGLLTISAAFTIPSSLRAKCVNLVSVVIM
jgi:hypothetical protein